MHRSAGPRGNSNSGAHCRSHRRWQILQRAFGGRLCVCATLATARAELIRTLQDRGVQQGIDVYMECTITRLIKDGERIAAPSPLARAGTVCGV